jgi:allantoate deiminase
MKWAAVHEAHSVACDTGFSGVLDSIAKKRQGRSIILASGAGHDAAAMAAITPVAMLFVRCKGGISHHPDESASIRDVRMAIHVMNDFLSELAGNHQ